MPSFDVVSEVDYHELSNAIDQSNREISKRFDFKGSNSRIEQNQYELTIITPSEFQVKQIYEILQNKLSKRGIDIKCLDAGEITESNKEAKQTVTVKHGLDKDTARKLVKIIKASKLKIQAVIQDEQIRVSGKKRDDLQEIMRLLKKQELQLPLQFNNFRD